MTRAEAINTLANFKVYISGGGVIDKKANEALDMAIEALNCSEIPNKSDTISRSAAIDAKMKKYRKKPIVIEAYQTDVTLDIETLEGIMHASAGDYIIIGVNGEQYPCKPDIFEKTYEEVSDECLPSAQPERKKGKWILECDAEGEGDNLYRCPECGCNYSCQEYDIPNFCPNCGSYNGGESDDKG